MAYVNPYHEEKQDEYNRKTDELLKSLPRFVTDYRNSDTMRTSILTKYIYIQRISIFFRWAEDSFLFDAPVKALKPQDMDAVTKADIDAFVNWVLGGNALKNDLAERAAERTKPIRPRKRPAPVKSSLKRTSVNNYLSALRSLWDYLFVNRYVQHNVIKDVARGRKVKKDAIAMSVDETNAMLKAIDTGTGETDHMLAARNEASVARDKALYFLMVRTGLRVSEVVGIDLDDLNLKERYVHVFRKEGKDEDVYFSDAVADLLEEYLAARPLVCANDKERALFVVTIGKYIGHRLSVRSIENIIKKYAKLAGVNKADMITPHKMRSTFASQMIAESGDLSLVQQMMAHESPSTTSLYINKRTEERKKNRGLLDGETH